MYSIEERIGASRTDAKGVLKLSEAVNMLQDCSLFWTESQPSLQEFMTTHHLGLIITSRQIDIVRLPFYNEKVTVRTSIFDCKSLMGYRNTVMVDKQNKPCLLTWSTGVLVNQETKKIARFPKTEIAQILFDNKVDMEYLDRRIVYPLDEAVPLPAIPVRRNDIDFYDHMNNAKYLEASLELLPATFPIKRVRIEYRMSARLGDTLYPLVVDQGAKQFIILADQERSPYSVMEFS